MFLKIRYSDQSAMKIYSDHQSQEAKVTDKKPSLSVYEVYRVSGSVKQEMCRLILTFVAICWH